MTAQLDLFAAAPMARPPRPDTAMLLAMSADHTTTRAAPPPPAPKPHQVDIAALAASWREARGDEIEQEQAIAEAEAAAEEWDPDDYDDEDEDDYTPPPRPPRDEAAEQAAFAERDPLGARLLQHGLAGSAYCLDINRSLATQGDFELAGDWALPSRMFQFPIITEGPRKDHHGNQQPRKLSLRHPALADHPFVLHTQQLLGMEIRHCTGELVQASADRMGQWWHAVDLVSKGEIDGLLRTERFTTAEDIIGAVVFGLRYGDRIDTRQARRLLAHVGSAEQPMSCIRQAFQPAELVATGENSKGWAIREIWVGVPDERRDSSERQAWAFVHGIERGLIQHRRGGHAEWSAKGRQWWEGCGESSLL